MWSPAQEQSPEFSGISGHFCRLDALPFLTALPLTQPDEGGTEDGESVHVLEHSPADPFTGSTDQVSGDLGDWDGEV